MRAAVRLAALNSLELLVGLGLALVFSVAGSAGAQSWDGIRTGVRNQAPTESEGDQHVTSVASIGLLGFDLPQPLRDHRGLAPIASLVVPGAGQLMLGKDRYLAYAAVEALSWWKYSKDVRDRSQQEATYKDLSRRVARAQFSSELPDASWMYYEWMRDRIESGRFSIATSGPVVPETDTSTYNGSRWQLALSTNPTYDQALAQYEREAIRPEYRWSWRNAQLQYDIYKRTTDKRNDAAHSAVQDALVIGANHILSLVDAFATIRLEARPGQRGQTQIGASLRW